MRVSSLLLLGVVAILTSYGLSAARRDVSLADPVSPAPRVAESEFELGTPIGASAPRGAAAISAAVAAIDGAGPAVVRYDLTIERDGEVLSTPAVTVVEGCRASVEIGDRCGSGDHVSVEILPTGQVLVSAILRDGDEVIALPELLVEVGEPAEMSVEGERLRSSFAVFARRTEL